MLRKWQALTSVLSLGTSKGLMVHRLEGVPASATKVSPHSFLTLGPSPWCPQREGAHLVACWFPAHSTPYSLLVFGMNERGVLGKRRRARRIPCDRKQRKRENFSHCQTEKKDEVQEKQQRQKKKNNLTTKWSMLTNAKPQREKWWGW